MEQNVFILFGLEEGDGMDFEFTQRGAIKSKERAMQMTAQLVIEARKELSDFLLCDGGGEVDIPDCQAGERFRIAREQAMQERGTAAQVAQDEKRLFDGLSFMTGEENVIEPETEPVEERSDRPDQVKQCEKDYSFACQSRGGVFCSKEGSIKCAPEEAEIIVHETAYPLVETAFVFGVTQRRSTMYKEKAREGLLLFFILSANCGL